MTASQAVQRYTTGAIILHWLIALMIIGQVAGGIAMVEMPDSPGKYTLFQWHKTFGLLALFLSLARLAWRFTNPPPPPPAMPAVQHAIASVTHWIFYALMIVVPLSGWIMVSASPTGVPTYLFSVEALPWPHIASLEALAAQDKTDLQPLMEGAHKALAFATIALMLGHIGAALKHQFIDRDRLMARVAPGLGGPTTQPSMARYSIPIAAATFAIPLVAGVAAAIVAERTAEHAPRVELDVSAPLAPAMDGRSATDTSTTEPTSTWVVNADQSTLAFAIDYQGQRLEGAIGNWNAGIRFDPDNLAASSARVVIDSASLVTGDSYFDGTLRNADGLRAREHPTITADVVNMRPIDEAGAHEADIVLTLFGDNTQSALPFQFVLELDGDQAHMTGSVAFNRMDFGLGRASDPTGSTAGLTVTVIADVHATREP